ncbi:hypothetical protein LINPERPRIM_LOCUS1776 [Linum perenne]
MGQIRRRDQGPVEEDSRLAGNLRFG